MEFLKFTCVLFIYLFSVSLLADKPTTSGKQELNKLELKKIDDDYVVCNDGKCLKFTAEELMEIIDGDDTIAQALDLTNAMQTKKELDAVCKKNEAGTIGMTTIFTLLDSEKFKAKVLYFAVKQWRDNKNDPNKKRKRSIDIDKYNTLIRQKAQYLSPDQLKDDDAKSLYDALATIASDRNCEPIHNIKVGESGRSKSMSSPLFKINPDVGSISYGDIVISYGERDRKETTIKYDANHFTPMKKEDWLYGLKSNKGFYEQLKKAKVCK